MIKRIYCFYLIFFLLISLVESVHAKKYFYVRWVDDGDTIVLVDGRRVRYIGINAPEIAHENQNTEPYGYAAKIFNKNLVWKKKIFLEFDREKVDQYGRVLGYVFLEDESFVNQRILEQGYAYFLYQSPNIKYHEVLLKAQRNAMTAKRGIWSNWNEKKELYRGNKKSKRFHLQTCPLGKKIAEKNRRHFQKKWDAFWEGYAPGRRCILKSSRPPFEKSEY